MYIKTIFGAVHFKTRFLHFLETNPKVSKNFIYFVDNYELYKDYINDYNIVDFDLLRKNHEWSNKYELFFYESNVTNYIKNFNTFYEDNDCLLPGSVNRFCLLYMYEKNILNFTYLNNNSFITDKQEILDSYLNSVPKGTFLAPLHGFDVDKNKYQPKKYNNVLYGTLGEALKSNFPNLIIPEEEYGLEYYFFHYHFADKEHLKLFYEIYDFIMRFFYENNIKMAFNKQLAYNSIDDVFGYIARIFEVNFNYQVNGFLYYWKNETHGVHHTTYHDNWYYKLPKNIEDNFVWFKWNNNDFIVPIECTTEKYIEINKNSLNNFFNHNLTHCNFEITENNNVIIKHKNN